MLMLFHKHCGQRLRGNYLFPMCQSWGPVDLALFADNCLLLGQASIRNAIDFKRILEQYCLASSQKVNLLKSTMYFNSRMPTQLQHIIMDRLGMVKHSDIL